MNWITVRHEDHGGETQIPEQALAGYRTRGWHPPAEFEAPVRDAEAVEAAESESADDADDITEEYE